MSHGSLASNTSLRVSVSDAEIDAAEMMAFVADPASGATVLFSGTVRDHSPGRDGVSLLEYEAYGAVVEDKIREIVLEAMARWSVIKIAAAHRTGSLDIGESAVMVAVSSSHRVDAFPAARYVIDELKGRAPIWKKEHWPGGAEWVEEAEDR
ncbi:MAG: molybdenum cofactor biosynthesis protein MoaE [Actinomycetia bacterium]|nr:molybdenum cofactor biosynthesis protein MoaE [Actinomycetes bacterium]